MSPTVRRLPPLPATAPFVPPPPPPPLTIPVPFPQSLPLEGPPSPSLSLRTTATSMKRVRPALLAAKIESFLGSPGPHRSHQLAALRCAPSAPVKLSRLCGRLMKCAMAIGLSGDRVNPDVQLDAFTHLINLTTRFPILRRLFLRSVSVAGVPVAESDIGALWPEQARSQSPPPTSPTSPTSPVTPLSANVHSHPDELARSLHGDASSSGSPVSSMRTTCLPIRGYEDEWDFYRALAGTCLLESEVWTVVSWEEGPIEAQRSDVSDVLARLVDLLQAAQTPVSRALCIRYIVGVFENNEGVFPSPNPPSSAISVSPTTPLTARSLDTERQTQILSRLSAALLRALSAMDDDARWEQGVGHDHAALDALLETILGFMSGDADEDEAAAETRTVVRMIVGRRPWLAERLPRVSGIVAQATLAPTVPRISIPGPLPPPRIAASSDGDDDLEAFDSQLRVVEQLPREAETTPRAAAFCRPEATPLSGHPKWDIELNIWTRAHLDQREDVLADWQSGKGFLLDCAETMTMHDMPATIIVPLNAQLVLGQPIVPHIDLDSVEFEPTVPKRAAEPELHFSLPPPPRIPAIGMIDLLEEEDEPEREDEHDVAVCAKCYLDFEDEDANEPVVKFGAALFHPRCFTCGKCASLLSCSAYSAPAASPETAPTSPLSPSSSSESAPSIPAPTTPLDTDLDSLLLVLTDADGTTPICTRCAYHCVACTLPILEEALLAGGDAYHSHCFRCRVCRRGLAGGQTDENDGEEMSFTKTTHGAYCMRCYNARAAKVRQWKQSRAKRKSGTGEAKVSPPPLLASC
ncbi:hypothetical protein MKEN_01015700 [Mycena kentingensis (nom. inval.)]|nr:hypothetical protein MKEN_01015700 [Mycena kentingensis (nom. inval.)]